MNAAEHITPPKAGKVQVLALVANTASTAQDTDHAGTGCRFLTIHCTEEFYILFTADGRDVAGALPDPVIATTGVGTTVDGRCWPLAADTPHHFTVTPDDRYFKAISTSNATLRWYLSSKQEG